MNDDLKQKTLMTTRIIAMALMAGQLIFLGIVLFLISQKSHQANRELGKFLVMVAGGMFVFCVAAAFIVRSKMWEKRPVDGPRFASGNVVFFALLEGPSLFGIVIILISGQVLPAIVIPVLSLALQAINFPNPEVME